MRLISLLIIAVVLTLNLSSSLLIKGQNQNTRHTQVRPGETIEEVDVNQFPIVDYVVEKQRAAIERAKWENRGKKYNSQHSPRIDEFSTQVFSFIDWERGLPALPVDRSSAVIIGEVIEAEAHFSSDETKIYSEFTVRIDEVFKNDHLDALSPRSTVTVERPGGRVRFPSGKIVIAAVSSQDLPRVGNRYVLFLTHDFIMGGSYDDALFIQTGYELRDGRVFPLDKVPSGHPINSYKGKDRESFLTDLAAVLAKAH